MEINLNGSSTETSAKTIAELLEEQEIASAGVAVAVGSKVIRRNDWETTILTPEMSVTIICATQGG